MYARISFDREKHKLYEVPIAAFDGGGRPGYSTVRISVTNDNDNAPLFTVSEYRAYVYENATIGTTVLQVMWKLFLTYGAKVWFMLTENKVIELYKCNVFKNIYILGWVVSSLGIIEK